jgi:threonine dehydrogenase-like Zn-dependent dehydrogenase
VEYDGRLEALEQTFRDPGADELSAAAAVVLGKDRWGMLTPRRLRIRGLGSPSPARPGSARDALSGIGYVSTTGTAIEELPEHLGGIDLVLEATGAAAVIAPAMSILGRDGVCIFASVTDVGRKWEIDLGTWNREMVLGNRLVFGTVNAARRHFEAAVRDLVTAEERLPGWMGRLITRRLPFTDAARALARSPQDIKTVLDFV